MGYEIPQQLEYKEKIMFGLTFKQLAYLFGFGIFEIIIFLKTPFAIWYRIALLVPPTALAIGFMWWDLDQKIKSMWKWIRLRRIELVAKKRVAKPKDFNDIVYYCWNNFWSKFSNYLHGIFIIHAKKIKKNSKNLEIPKNSKMDKFVGVDDYKDGLIITKDKRKIAVLKVRPVNFAIKSEDAKEVTALMFQKFLNAIDFPVQISMHTEALNIRNYLNEIDKKVKKEGTFTELAKEYKTHLQNTMLKNNVMNRNFYVIIPETSNIEIQLQIVEKKLKAIGLKTFRLNDRELKGLVNKFFAQPQYLLNKRDYLLINKTYHRIIYAHGYPRNVEAGFLDKIVSCLGDFDLSLHIEPYPIETMMINLNKELQKQRADLYSAQIKNMLNPSLEIKYSDTKSTLENLQKGREKLFDVSLFINCRAQSLQELDLLTKRIEAELNSLLIIPKIPKFRMIQGFISCAPFCDNRLKVKRNVPTGALSAFFPFTSSFLQADATGVWLGLNKNNIPIIKDIFTLSNPNGLCLASSGSGKSYMAKLLISRYLLNGVKVMVIDPQGEYRSLVKKFGGQLVDLSRTSDTIINPMDLMGHDYAEKRLALMDLMGIMLGELSEPQKSLIDEAISEAYERRMINKNKETWNNTPPILGDVLEELESMEEDATAIEKTTIRSLVNRLNLYVKGVFSFLNQHTKINFDNNFVCFDIGNMPKQVKPIIMFLVLDYIFMKMKSDLTRKMLVIDEAWSLLSRAADASYIFEIVKTCRKFNLALFLINQEVEGMLSTDAGKSVLANSAYTLLMRQKPAVIRDIQNTFYLSDAEKASLLTAGVGEGLLLMDDEHSEIKIIASPEEHKIITTNPDERLQQEDNKESITAEEPDKTEPQRPQKDIDPDVRIYLASGLNESERKYFLSKGFKRFYQKNISGKKTEYLLKPYKKESSSHMILVFEIVEYLKKYNVKYEAFRTLKPDVVFTHKNKRYAVEVETGKVYSKSVNSLKKKVNLLNKTYGQNWFFVVSSWNNIKYYKKYGKTFAKNNIRDKLHDMMKSE